jgi:hypothetical protein
VKSLHRPAAALALAVAIGASWVVPARAAETSSVDLKVDAFDGAGFVDGPLPSLFGPLAQGLQPGGAAKATMAAANRGTSPARLTVQALAVEDRENGCTEPERDVDATCADDDGEAAGAYVVRAFVDSDGASAFPAEPAWQGPFADLAGGVTFGQRLDPGATWGLRLEVGLPDGAGNAVQTDGVVFALGLTLTEEASSVAGVQLTAPLAVPAGTGPADTVIVGSLPRTGLDAGRMAAAGVLLVASGLGVVAGRRRLGRCGDAWVLLVDFAEGKATGWSVLAYGQTTNLASPHSRDQIRMFASHQLRRAWYTEAEVRANLEREYRP